MFLRFDVKTTHPDTPGDWEDQLRGHVQQQVPEHDRLLQTRRTSTTSGRNRCAKQLGQQAQMEGELVELRQQLDRPAENAPLERAAL